jgi:hypothetical protein
LVKKLLFTIFLSSSTLLSSDILYDKLENLIGSDLLNKHKKIVDVIFFDNRSKYYFNSDLKL